LAECRREQTEAGSSINIRSDELFATGKNLFSPLGVAGSPPFVKVSHWPDMRIQSLCEHRRLRQVELIARGLDNFSRADPPITKAVQLPDWEYGAKMAWPRAEPSLAVQFATSMTFSQHPGDDWRQQRKERTACSLT
jgi:hypothetical protein